MGLVISGVFSFDLKPNSITKTKEIIINVEYKLYCLNFCTYLTAFACISISATYRDIIIL